MTKHVRKNIILCSILLSAILLAAVFIVLLLRHTDNGILMRINGRPVWEEEFAFFYQQNQLKLEEELQQKGVPATETALIRQCRELIVSIKVQQEIAESLGCGSFDYYTMQKQMEDTNRENKEKIAAGQPVYGLQSYSFDQYYSRTWNSALLQMKQILFNGDLKPTQEEIQTYYTENRSRFELPDEFTFLLLGCGEDTTQSRDALAAVSTQDCKDFASVGQIPKGLTMERKTLNQEGFRSFSKENEALARALSALGPEQASAVVETEEGVKRLYCISRIDSGVQPLEEVQESIVQSIGEVQYENYVKEMIAKAQIWEKEFVFMESD